MNTKHSLTLVASALALASMSCATAQEAGGEQRMQEPTEMQGEMKMQGQMNPAQVDKMTQGWPEASRKAITFMTEKYGPPAAVTADLVVWGETGPWEQSIVYRNAVPHDFPMPHPDVLQQWVNHEAPVDMYDELAHFDGSVVVERTTGRMSARCDKEAANILALNLAHDVAYGERSVEEARMAYGKAIMAMMSGKPAPATTKLMFEPKPDAVGDPGETLEMMKDM